MPRGKLVITLVSVSDIKTEDLRTNDLVVKVELGRESHKSKTYQNARSDHTFDGADVFEFSVSGLEARVGDLEFKLYDKDALGDTDDIGKAEVDVDDVIRNAGGLHTISVKPRGSLTFRASWAPH